MRVRHAAFVRTLKLLYAHYYFRLFCLFFLPFPPLHTLELSLSMIACWMYVFALWRKKTSRNWSSRFVFGCCGFVFAASLAWNYKRTWLEPKWWRHTFLGQNEIKSHYGKIILGSYRYSFFSPLIPFKESKGCKECAWLLSSSLIPFKESKWCDWIPFFPFKESNWFRIQGLWSSVTPGSKDGAQNALLS